MPFVVDASVAASWAFDDEDDPVANLALERVTKDSVLAPSVIWFELRSALLAGERRGRSTEIRTAKFLEWFERIEVQLDVVPVESQVFALARRHRLSFYDAAYLELASRLNAPLATLAENLPLLQAP